MLPLTRKTEAFAQRPKQEFDDSSRHALLSTPVFCLTCLCTWAAGSCMHSSSMHPTILCALT